MSMRFTITLYSVIVILLSGGRLLAGAVRVVFPIRKVREFLARSSASRLPNLLLDLFERLLQPFEFVVARALVELPDLCDIGHAPWRREIRS